MGLQFILNTLKDRIARGVASVKERAMVEYYDYTRGGKERPGDWFRANFFELPFSYSRMNDWVHYRQAEYEYDKSVSQAAEKARRDTFFSPHYMNAANHGYTGSFDDWKREYVKNINHEDFELTKWNPRADSNFFNSPTTDNRNNPEYLRTQAHGFTASGASPRQFSVLDIETDDHGRPISVSVLKQQYNRATGKFETIDRFQRYYESRNADLTQTIGTHGLSASILHKLRKQQFQGVPSEDGKSIYTVDSYSRHYNDKEEEELRKFLGDSVIVGHNIVDFDLPHLFKEPLGNQTIDTMTAARNMWAGRKNDLDSVFFRLFGKTMEQAGLSHHDSMSDVIATAMIVQEMVKMKGNTGDALRYVMTTAGTHIAPQDEYLQSQVMTGYYNQYNDLKRYIDMKDYDGTEISIGDLMDSKQKFEFDYDKEAGKKVLPEEYHYDGEVRDYDVVSDIALFSQSLTEVAKDIKEASHVNGAFAQEMRRTMEASSFAEMRRFRENVARYDDPADREEYIKASGYGDNEVLNIMKGTDQLNALYHKHRDDSRAQAQEIASQQALQKAMWRARREGNSWDIETLQAAEGQDPETVWNALQDVEDSRKDIARRAKESAAAVQAIQDLEREEQQFEHQKARKIQKFSKKYSVSKEDEERMNLAGDMEELGDIMDEVADKNIRLTKTFQALASIPMYNFERLEQVFKGEVSSIRGAAKGLVSDAIYNPFSRLIDASMNSLTYQSANLKFGVRAGTTIGSGLMAAGGAMAASGIGAVPGLITMGIGGLASIGSQIFGNAQEARITKWGEDIQNNLNTIGMMKEFILMPFRLLASAVRNLIKGFGMLSSVIRGFANLMTSGLGSMTQMGNPLTGMTGVGYGDYMGSISIDHASLLGRGTVNGIYEDMAQQRMKLYTTGQLDTNRLVASSMLGVFNPIYGSSMNEEDSLTAAMNHLREVTKTTSDIQRKQLYVLVNMINPSMGALLQTMDTLGIDNFTDMKHPAGMWGYGEGALDKARRGWQRAQWEYGYAGEQLNISKMNIGVRLWDAFGKPVYNTINKLAYSISRSDWKSVGTQVKELWEIIKEGAGNLWNAVREAFGIDKNITLSAYLKGTVKNAFIDLGIGILEAIKEWYPKVMEVWDAFFDNTLKTVSTFVSSLGTIRINFKELRKMLNGEKHGVWLTSAWSDVSELGDSNDRDMAKLAVGPKNVSLIESLGLWDEYDKMVPNVAASHGTFVRGYEKAVRQELPRKFLRNTLSEDMNLIQQHQGDDEWNMLHRGTYVSTIATILNNAAGLIDVPFPYDIDAMIRDGKYDELLLLYDKYQDAALKQQLLGLSDPSAFAASNPELFSPGEIKYWQEHNTFYNTASSMYKTTRKLSNQIVDSGLQMGINELNNAKNVVDLNITMEDKPVLKTQVYSDGSVDSKIPNRIIDIKNEDSSVRFYINAASGRAGN